MSGNAWSVFMPALCTSTRCVGCVPRNSGNVAVEAGFNIEPWPSTQRMSLVGPCRISSASTAPLA